ncbi:MAG: ATP-binding protein [Chloroflexi bacterium]|nr:ATP-binding protein [Chloroflexota bacterium]
MSSKLANLARISAFVSEQARLVGMTEDQIFEVQMAVDEACTNAMEHAYGGREDGEVRVCCYTEGDDFVVRVTDFGEPFDPDAVPQPRLDVPLEQREVGGLGLFFMRKLMDRVDIATTKGQGNQVVMYKRHRKPS